MYHHLSEPRPIPPEIPVEYARPPYTDLITEVGHSLPPNHNITYVPLTEEQVADDAGQFTYAKRNALPGILESTDAIICISRDEDPSPDYHDSHPEYNITLTPSGRSNVDTCIELYNMAQKEGNTDARFIATGRMHNRAVRSMLALPVIADHLGVEPGDFYHMPETRFRELLDESFTRENIARLRLDPEDPEMGAYHKALLAVFEDPKYNATVPTPESSDEELRQAAESVWQEYKAYPRVSTSRLMVERAASRGVPLEAIVEEDGAVDTITNLLNTARIITEGELGETEIRRVVIVAGSDQLPRTMWIADHILPDGIEIVCVESDPSLSQGDYDASCVRELNSFRKGSNWIKGTRDLGELTEITEKGYFSTKRVDAAELARRVAAHGAGAAAVKHS